MGYWPFVAGLGCISRICMQPVVIPGEVGELPNILSRDGVLHLAD